jgi:hypothetical protein
MELQHLSGELLSRINLYLGSQTVRQLRFMQSIGSRPAPRPGRIPDKAAGLAALEATASLPEGPLRTALAGLGRAVLTETASRLGQQPRTRV